MPARVQLTVAVPVHVQPLPVTLLAVRPAGIGSVTATVLSSVGASLPLVTASVSVLPTDPATNVAGLCVASIVIGDSAKTYGGGGVPGRTSRLYGTGLTISGISRSDAT